LLPRRRFSNSDARPGKPKRYERRARPGARNQHDKYNDIIDNIIDNIIRYSGVARHDCEFAYIASAYLRAYSLVSGRASADAVAVAIAVAVAATVASAASDDRAHLCSNRHGQRRRL
jgi:hypothetical protein